MNAAPSVLVFDVNETLIDIESLTPFFRRLFGDSSAMRMWFGQLVMYSMSVTLSERYVDFFTLAQAVLRMLATTAGVQATDDDVLTLKRLLLTMPAHPEVEEGLAALRNKGFRIVSLSNSPPNPNGPSPLEHAGLSHLFERQFSVDEVRSFKPGPASYRYVSAQLGVDPTECMMVAAHVWDTIGAQSTGFGGALITRPGNAQLPVAGLPQPTIVAPDLRALAAELSR